MSDVLKFASLDLPRSGGVGWGGPFEGLNTRHFIHTHGMFPSGIAFYGLGISRTDAFHLLAENQGVFFRCIEPIGAAMRLKIGLVLKNAPLGAQKYFRQSRV
jgi:hypothetical protein